MGQCDDCCARRVKTRRIELGGHSGITLCDSCLRKEIAWRKERNKTLDPKVRFRTNYKFGTRKKKRKTTRSTDQWEFF